MSRNSNIISWKSDITFLLWSDETLVVIHVSESDEKNYLIPRKSHIISWKSKIMTLSWNVTTRLEYIWVSESDEKNNEQVMSHHERVV